jgi:hypothetical protein
MKNSLINENLEELEYGIKQIKSIKNVGFAMVRLVFLKYIFDNKIGVKTDKDVEFYKYSFSFFTNCDIGGGPNTLYPILWMMI